MRPVFGKQATVSQRVRELDSGQGPLGRVRTAGGGRRRIVDLNAALWAALLARVELDMRGDPVSPLRWTTESTRNLAGELTPQGHRISADTVGDLLRAQGFSLQSNAKTLEVRQHPDRDVRFRCLNWQARTHQDSGDPLPLRAWSWSCAASGSPFVGGTGRAAPARRRTGPPLLVLQRSLRRSRQVLRVAMACSPSARILAWETLTARWPAESLSERPR